MLISIIFSSLLHNILISRLDPMIDCGWKQGYDLPCSALFFYSRTDCENENRHQSHIKYTMESISHLFCAPTGDQFIPFYIIATIIVFRE